MKFQNFHKILDLSTILMVLLEKNTKLGFIKHIALLSFHEKIGQIFGELMH
jgi:hypothetical protein